MNLTLEKQKQALKAMTGQMAAQWIMDSYPLDAENYGIAYQFISSRSWAKAEQSLLANYYLSKLPFASSTPYEVFLSKMSIKLFLTIVERYLPTDVLKLNLLEYHLKPLITQEKYTKDKDLVINFLRKLN